MSIEQNRVCPVELAGSLDNKVRKWLQNPVKIVGPYIKEGMKVLDVGCGPGFFSVEIAKMVGSTGKIFSADLQEGMLQKLREKIHGTFLEERIELIKCEQDEIKVPEKVNFILAFFMVHEVPDKDTFFATLINLLEKDGLFLIVEPKFHVSNKDFNITMEKAGNAGFVISQEPKLPLCYSVILKNI